MQIKTGGTKEFCDIKECNIKCREQQRDFTYWKYISCIEYTIKTQSSYILQVLLIKTIEVCINNIN